MSVSECLTKQPFKIPFIRAYGECCVDDVTASHASANDMIVHFGHSCLSTDQNMQVVTAESKNKSEEEQKKKLIVYMLLTPNKIV